MNDQNRPASPGGQSTALAIVRDTQRPREEIVIRTPDEYRGAVARFQAMGAHLLTPLVDIGALPEYWTLVPSAVLMNPDPDAGDVYMDRLFCKDHEVALAKPGLRRIVVAYGASTHVTRTDPRTIPFYWEFSVVLTWMGTDGNPRSLEASADYDLRDDAPRVKVMEAAAKKNNKSPAAQIQAARMYGYRGGESRAINAAVRELGIRQKYTRKELDTPFVVFVPHFTPDPQNAEQMRMYTAHALGNVKLLYGTPEVPLLEGNVDKETGEIKEPVIPDGEPFEPEPEQAPVDEQGDPDEPTYTVTGVFKLAKGFYLTVKELGDRKLLTDDGTLANHAYKTKKAGTKVTLALEGDVILEMADAA